MQWGADLWGVLHFEWVQKSVVHVVGVVSNQERQPASSQQSAAGHRLLATAGLTGKPWPTCLIPLTAASQ